MRESAIFKAMMLAIHRIPGVRVFRQNVGQAFAGKNFRLKPGQTYRAKGGEMVIMAPRVLHAGLIKGSGDGIGWRTVTITPEMVGREIAQFVSVETKTATGEVRAEQETWAKNVNRAGGCALIVRSAEEAEEGLRQIEL